MRIKNSLMLTPVFFILVSFFSSFLVDAYAFDANKTFNKKCSSCHTFGKGDKVGPDLKDITKRRDREWIYKFVPSPKAMIDSGDKVAVELQEKYQDLMPDQELEREEIEEILKLLEGGGPTPIKKKLFIPKANEANPFVKKYFFVMVLILFLVLSLVAFKLRRKSLAVVTMAAFVLGTIGGTIIEARKIGLNEGYGPEQPVKYSHLVHAGENEIPCEYCHFGATKGRTAGIPPAELCFNCHDHIKTKVVQEATDTQPEITEDSDQMKIVRTALAENKPIEWVKVNLLPDHVYFNHAQHVSVAGLECQTCHGAAQTYEVMYQKETLSMGWCLDCHRRNGIAPPKDHKSEAGGDCSKCHY